MWTPAVQRPRTSCKWRHSFCCCLHLHCCCNLLFSVAQHCSKLSTRGRQNLIRWIFTCRISLKITSINNCWWVFTIPTIYYPGIHLILSKSITKYIHGALLLLLLQCWIMTLLFVLYNLQYINKQNVQYMYLYMFICFNICIFGDLWLPSGQRKLTLDTFEPAVAHQ